MASLTDSLQKIILLVSSVDRLEAKIRSLDEQLRNHHERIVRLEGSGDLIAEKAKNAALQGAQASSMELMKEIYALKAQLGDAQHSLRTQISRSPSGGTRSDGEAAK
jgi:hypothetical protein